FARRECFAMKRRFLLLLTLLCSASAFAQLAPAPGFQPKSQTAPPPQSTTPAPAETTPAPATAAAPPSTTPTAPANAPVAPTTVTTTTTTSALAHNLTIPADKQWTDTGIDLKAGDKVTITSDGSIVFGG